MCRRVARQRRRVPAQSRHSRVLCFCPLTLKVQFAEWFHRGEHTLPREQRPLVLRGRNCPEAPPVSENDYFVDSVKVIKQKTIKEKNTHYITLFDVHINKTLGHHSLEG